MSGPEGTPNGVDRLAHIEARVLRVMGREYEPGEIPAGFFNAEDVLALVEIAKAARDIPDMDTPETDALYRALARLDSGATEGDA